MKFVAQRVLRASLSVNGVPVSEIGRGLVVFFGIGEGDTQTSVKKGAEKLAALRVFEDEAGKMNRALADVGGEVLFVSQFTLYGDCDRGNRPSFTAAARPEIARTLYECAGKHLEALGVPVKYGVFGADMRIEQVNDGPVTIVWEYPKKQGEQ